MTRTTTSIVALLTVLAASSAANASQNSRMTVDPAGYPQVTVSYSDLDLSRPAGAQAMLSRLRYAARSVCGSFDERNISALRANRACNKQAMDNAVAAVASPLVAELHGAPGVKTASTASWIQTAFGWASGKN